MSRFGFGATPASEELASFLVGLAPGAHVAVALGALNMDIAAAVSRQVALARHERFIVIAHQGSGGTELVADSLTQALPLEMYAAPRNKALIIVDAASSIAAQSAQAHADAEKQLGTQVASRLTVVCFYTEDALRHLTPDRVHHLHSVVAAS